MSVETYFLELLNDIPNASSGKMFGCLAAKMPNGKAGMFLKYDTLIVKISPEIAEQENLEIFTPKENRPMNGWYEITFENKEVWKKWAEISCGEVAQLPPNKNKK